jgi:hypothetical protein
MAADLETQSAKLSHLGSIQIPTLSDESGCDVKRSAEAKIPQDRSGTNKVRLAAIIKSDGYILRLVTERVAHTYSTPTLALEELHLGPEFGRT